METFTETRTETYPLSTRFSQAPIWRHFWGYIYLRYIYPNVSMEAGETILRMSPYAPT